MKNLILLAGIFALSGCGMGLMGGVSVSLGEDEKAPKSLAQNLDGPSEAKELCAWLTENKRVDKEGNVDWVAMQGSNGYLKIQASCAGTPIADLIFHQSIPNNYNKERDLKITLRQDTPKGGSLVYRNVETYSTSIYETSTRSVVTDLDVIENGSNELAINFKSSGKLKKTGSSSPSEHKLSFEGRVELFLRGKMSASFTQKSFGDYDYTGAYELDFKLE